MKLKNKDLKDIASKLNTIAELEDEEQFDSKMDPKELREELEAAVAGKGTDDGLPEIEITVEDDLTDHEWAILAELGCPAALGESEEEEGQEDGDDDGDDDGEEEEEVPAYDDIMGMKKKQLKEVINEHELDVNPDNYKRNEEINDFRQAVAEALGVAEEEEGEEGEPEEELEEGEEEEGEAEEGVTYEDLQKMTKKKDLKTVIEEHELDVDPTQFKVPELREEIAKALNLIEDEQEEEEEEEQQEEEPEVPSYDEVMAMKKNGLKEVIKEHDLEADSSQKLADLREDVASELGLEAPKKGKAKSEGKKSESKSESKGNGKGKSESKPKKEMTRADAALKAIDQLCKKKGATLNEIMEKSNELYANAGGTDNSKTGYNLHRHMIMSLEHFNIVERDNQGKIKFSK